MTHDRSVLERVLDIAVYAPIGLLVCIRDHLPRRTVGRGQVPADRVQPACPGPRRVEVVPVAAIAATDPSTAPSPSELSADDLPIDGYESLAAIHVVERLGSLTDHDLRLILGFENGHRSRRTILAKIAQLQAN